MGLSGKPNDSGPATVRPIKGPASVFVLSCATVA
jgi:hypothetical protein